jgi:hypothetical protein
MTIEPQPLDPRDARGDPPRPPHYEQPIPDVGDRPALLDYQVYAEVIRRRLDRRHHVRFDVGSR